MRCWNILLYKPLSHLSEFFPQFFNVPRICSVKMKNIVFKVRETLHVKRSHLCKLIGFYNLIETLHGMASNPAVPRVDIFIIHPGLYCPQMWNTCPDVVDAATRHTFDGFLAWAVI